MTNADHSERAAKDTSEDDKRPLLLWRGLALLVFAAVLIGAAVFANSTAGMNWINGYHSFPQMIQDMGFWGQFGIIALMIIHCFVPFPAEFVALAAGGVFGPVYGTFLTWAGAMIGAMFSFALTRAFGQPVVTWLLSKRQKQLLDQWTDDQGAMTLLVSRFIPVIAFNLINYAAGLTRVSWWTFFWTTGVGILPLTALMVYMGSKMRHLSWESLLILSAVCIAIMAVLHWYRRKISRS